MTDSLRQGLFWRSARGRILSISLLVVLLTTLLALPSTARGIETTDWFWDVAFTDASNGCIVGSGGAVYRTTDGGDTWAERTSGTSADLYGLDFGSATHGWAVGDLGTILKTTNGGSTWTAQSSGTDEKLRDVVFTDEDHGWAVGDLGIVLRTVNGGTTWTAQDEGIALRGVTFLDNLQGWIVGDSGTILTTVNGGTDWTPQTSGRTERLYSVAFTSATNGCAVGDLGTILTTTDGGANWTPRNASTGRALRDIIFTDAATGWVVGSGGTIMKTANGGVNWTKHSSGTELYLLGVCFTSDDNGWICGETGTLLSTTTGAWPDIYPPTTVATGIDPDVWYNTPPTITFTATDNGGGSGVDYTEYSYDDGENWSEGSSAVVPAPANHSNDGSHNVLYRSIDNASNVEDVQSITVKIDTTEPSGTFALEGGAAETATRSISGDSAVSDAHGPLDMRVSTDDKGTWSEWGAYAASTSVMLPVGFGTKTVYAQYRDIAGNVVELSDTIELVDGTAPTTTASGASATAWYRTARTITFVAADNAGGSGVAKTEYSRDGTTWTEGTSVVVGYPDFPNGRNTISYRSTDVSGNVEATKSIKVNIDTVGPTTYGAYVSGRSGKYVSLKYKIADKYSPKAYSVKIYVKNSSGKVLKAFYLGTRSKNTWYKVSYKTPKRGTYRYYVYAKDAAGNAQRVAGTAQIVVR